MTRIMVRILVALLTFATSLQAQPRTDIHGDPLPEGALVRFGTVRYRLGPNQHVEAFAMSPDGKTLAVETSDVIALWEVDTGRVALRFAIPGGHDIQPIQLKYSPDGKSLVRLSGWYLQGFEAQTGRERFGWRLERRGQAISFLAGTSHFTLVQGDCTELWTFDAKDGSWVTDVEADVPVEIPSASGQFFLSDYGSRWQMVDARTGKVRCRLPELPELPTRSAPFDRRTLVADDRRVCAMDPDGRLRVFDAGTGRLPDDVDPPADWADPEEQIRLAMSPDGAVAYLSQRDRTTLRRDLATRKWLPALPVMPGGPLVPHPDGRRILLLGDDGVIHRYNLATRIEIRDPLGFDEQLCIAPSPDGRRLAITSGRLDGRLDMVELTGRLLWSAPLGRSPGYPRWSPDGGLIAATSRREVKVIEPQTGKLLTIRRSSEADLHFTGMLGFDGAGQKLFAVLNNGEAVAEFDLKGGDATRVMTTDIRGAIDLSPDGRTLAFANGSPPPALFDLSTGRFRVGFALPSPPAEGRACGGGGFSCDSAADNFSPDGSYLLTWWRDIGLFWDPVSGEHEKTILTGLNNVRISAFSPDGLWLAVVSDARTISFWDVASEKMLVTWDGPADHSIRSVAFAGSGRLVTSSDDLTAILWDLRPRKKLKVSPWDALSGDDPTDAYRAVWALAEDPKGPELLRAKIAPAKSAQAGPVKKWIADLGAPRYAVREEAASVLGELGRRIELELRAARKQATSEEVRTRLDAILAKLSRARDESDVVRARAVAAMELAGTDAARKLLSEWAAGAPGARLTQDAKAAQVRLGVTVPNR